MNSESDNSNIQPVLLLDDGELDDVREILRSVTSEVLHLRGGMIPEVLEPPDKLFVATSRRAVVAGNWPTHSPGEGPVRVAVVTDDSNTLRSMLRRIGFDLLVRRPFHPYALRLLFLRALYSGDERRREIRAPIGAEITFRQGLRRRSAILADLSPKGCRLLSSRNLPVGTRVTVQFPKELVGRKSIPMRAKVVRATNAKHENLENQWSLGMMFQDMTLEAKQQIQRILKGAVELSVVSEEVATTVASQAERDAAAAAEAEADRKLADPMDDVFDGEHLTSDSALFEPNLFKAGEGDSGIFAERPSEPEEEAPEQTAPARAAEQVEETVDEPDSEIFADDDVPSESFEEEDEPSEIFADDDEPSGIVEEEDAPSEIFAEGAVPVTPPGETTAALERQAVSNSTSMFEDDDPPTPVSDGSQSIFREDDDPPTPIASPVDDDATPAGFLEDEGPAVAQSFDEDDDPPTLPDAEIHGATTPLAAAGSAEERRKQERGHFPENVVELGDIANRVLVGRDLSAGGMRVDPQEDLVAGMRLKLALYGDAREEPFVVHALVLRNDGDAGVALQFENVSGEVGARLEGMVADLPRVESLQDGEDDNIGTIVSQILEGDLFDPIEAGG